MARRSPNSSWPVRPSSTPPNERASPCPRLPSKCNCGGPMLALGVRWQRAAALCALTEFADSRALRNRLDVYIAHIHPGLALAVGATRRVCRRCGFHHGQME